MTATLPGTGFSISTLDNGLRVLTAARPGDTMCAMLFVTAGSRYENRETSGVAHMLEHLFFSGTPRRPTQRAIATEIDSWGCRFNALTDQEYTAYYIHGAATYAERALELVADLIQHAVLPPADIERERQVIFAELRARQDNQRQVARQMANLALYGDAPMGWETVGFPDVLQRLDRDDLMAFRGALYQPQRMIVSVAGPMPHEDVVELAERYFDALGDGTGLADPEPASYAAPTNVATTRDSRLAHLYLVGPGPAYAQPEREMMAARLMNAVFGSSMSSRLFASVREQQALCYSIRSTVDPCADVGAFLVATGVSPGKAAQLIGSVSVEMTRLSGDGPTPPEMAKARAIVKGTSALDREDAAALARLSAFELMHRGYVRDRSERNELADSISTDEVAAAARRYLDPAVIRCALAGPADLVPQLVDANCLESSEWTVVA